MRYHRGPFNLQCCSAKNPIDIEQIILRSLKFNAVHNLQILNDRYYYQCQIDNIKFDIEIAQLYTRKKMTDNVYILLFYNRSLADNRVVPS